VTQFEFVLEGEPRELDPHPAAAVHIAAKVPLDSLLLDVKRSPIEMHKLESMVTDR
jgi:hypothetical protein